ncbi:hypothetical protein BN7_731 [Wickerhamomyces ciferrii]|uniref:Zn(2)-C6 fungal-type domain-containing protein n=1 Tax=Wickerhamomyces ciferrii (strain ATCC 14091 / BCRC 22168 / CBS 111 / JCM 3599 / NBRC 0793 / NRRL Y-1031 F-60-10) TaxID=1206466 RepID=K0KIH4_WICCF|nr:uncharacterized protein BN7_731 [Wickerhamomyces ciferrii]CCH41194.1 hypothetical protein BN7_731 [Wickerhamomyces ciferrii]
MKPTACIGCRLRRRRCDRKTPICSSCSELKIPVELCIYKDLHSNKKTSSGKDVLEEVIAEKIQLTREKFKWKRLLEAQLQKQTISNHYRYDMKAHSNTNKVEYNHDDGILLNKDSINWNGLNIDSKEPKPTNICGSLSWGSLMAVEPNMKSMLSKIDEVIINEKQHIKNARDIVEAPAKGNYLVTKIKENLYLHTLFGETVFKYDMLIDSLFRDIESNLPNEKAIRHIISHQCKVSPLELVGWMGTDEDIVLEKLNSVISFNKKNGSAKIHINSFEDPTKIANLTYVLSFLILPAYYKEQLSSTKRELNEFLMAEYTELLTYIFNRISPVDGNSLHIFPQLTLERLQSWLYMIFFFKFTPSGRTNDNDNPLDITMSKTYVINLCRVMGLNTNIDETFSHLSVQYRKSMKSFWHLLQYIDAMEVLQTGLPPTIKPSEIIRYDDLSNVVSETTLVLNRILYNYNTMDFGQIKDPEIFIKIIENEFIKDIEVLLQTEYGSLEEELNILKFIDLDDPQCSKDLLNYSARFTQRFHIYTLMQTLYYFCYKKLESFDKYSKRRIKFGILSMKYSSLIIYLLRESFNIWSTHIKHPKSYERGVSECAMGCYPHVNVSVRTVFACAGGRLFQGLPIDDASVMKNFIMGKKINEEQLLNEISLQDEFKILFSLKDLEDLEIDHDDLKLFEKFSILANHKYIIFSFSKMISEISTKFFQDDSNKTVGRLNVVFFYLLKITSFFLNSSFTSDGKPIENEHFYIGFKDPLKKNTGINNSIKNSEFTFGQLFEETLNTSSTNFDFQDFFNFTNFNGFESNEIDDFLLNCDTDFKF